MAERFRWCGYIARSQKNGKSSLDGNKHGSADGIAYAAGRQEGNKQVVNLSSPFPGGWVPSAMRSFGRGETRAMTVRSSIVDVVAVRCWVGRLLAGLQRASFAALLLRSRW